MATEYRPDLIVNVGNAAKARQYNRLSNNVDCLRAALDVGHDIGKAAGGVVTGNHIGKHRFETDRPFKVLSRDGSAVYSMSIDLVNGVPRLFLKTSDVTSLTNSNKDYELPFVQVDANGAILPYGRVRGTGAPPVNNNDFVPKLWAEENLGGSGGGGGFLGWTVGGYVRTNSTFTNKEWFELDLNKSEYLIIAYWTSATASYVTSVTSADIRIRQTDGVDTTDNRKYEAYFGESLRVNVTDTRANPQQNALFIKGLSRTSTNPSGDFQVGSLDYSSRYVRINYRHSDNMVTYTKSGSGAQVFLADLFR